MHVLVNKYEHFKVRTAFPLLCRLIQPSVPSKTFLLCIGALEEQLPGVHALLVMDTTLCCYSNSGVQWARLSDDVEPQTSTVVRSGLFQSCHSRCYLPCSAGCPGFPGSRRVFCRQGPFYRLKGSSLCHPGGNFERTFEIEARLID